MLNTVTKSRYLQRQPVLAPYADGGVIVFAIEAGQAYVLFANTRGRHLFKNTSINGSMMPLENLVAQLPIVEDNVERLKTQGECFLEHVRCNGDDTAWHVMAHRESDVSTRTIVIASEMQMRYLNPQTQVLESASINITGAPHADYATAGLPEIAEADPDAQTHDVFIRTFGYFEVFVDGTPIIFHSAKSKELLALLVDRRGGYVTAADVIAHLWENDPATPTVLSRQRKVAMRLKHTLHDHGIGHIVESVRGKRRLNVNAVRCDLYDFLAGDPEAQFFGTYLQNYSWGEVTLGELLTMSS